jgi:hypothetical protein
MRRREFITLLGGAAAWVSPARAQEPRGVIGVLGSATSGALPGAEAAFIEGLTNTGFIEGKNISIEWRWAERQYNRLSSLVGELKAFQYSEPFFLRQVGRFINLRIGPARHRIDSIFTFASSREHGFYVETTNITNSGCLPCVRWYFWSHC